MDILLSGVGKDIYGMITSYLDSKIVIYTNYYSKPILDNMMYCLSDDLPNLINFLIYLDNMKSPLLNYYTFDDSIYIHCLENINRVSDVYSLANVSNDFVLINKKEKYLVMRNIEKSYATEYHSLYPCDVLNLEWDFHYYGMDGSGYDYIYVLRSYSSPLVVIDFVEKYKPKNYTIMTIPYYNRFYVTQEFSRDSIIIKNGIIKKMSLYSCNVPDDF